MIDPLISLASSIPASLGVYVLTLGSGASRAAGIPTGWKVTVDLIRRPNEVSADEKTDRASKYLFVTHSQVTRARGAWDAMKTLGT